MSGADKTRNKVDNVRGIAKSAVEQVTGNPRLEAEGSDRQRASRAQRRWRKIKDVFRPRRFAAVRRRDPSYLVLTGLTLLG
ncbi:hypothetical protein MSIMFB_04389 [Mycobacterium simulans]|uniref:CsbD family protein n=1 Tax=Mycobacterium simulans TaxID=627089 RepID=A0A7Z7IPH0_9MYCO|nr:CsbD family protein [Mycobacterium simulans]SOJ56912.1 hypothetical protein MSIMFB_04389 [Mycobacterium simulans]